MEKKFVSNYMKTGFYLNLESRTYGVCINVSDIEKKDEIINYFRENRKEQIDAWKKEWGVE